MCGAVLALPHARNLQGIVTTSVGNGRTSRLSNVGKHDTSFPTAVATGQQAVQYDAILVAADLVG